MARASQIYLVESKKTGRALAAFTVKYESQKWAEWAVKEGHVKSLNDLERVRMRDGGNYLYLFDPTIFPCPWE